MWGLIGGLGEAGLIGGENLVQGPGVEQSLTPGFECFGIGVFHAGGHFSREGAEPARQLPGKQTRLAPRYPLRHSLGYPLQQSQSLAFINPFLSDIRHHDGTRLFLNRGQQAHDFVAIDLSKRLEDILYHDAAEKIVPDPGSRITAGSGSVVR